MRRATNAELRERNVELEREKDRARAVHAEASVKFQVERLARRQKQAESLAASAHRKPEDAEREANQAARRERGTSLNRSPGETNVLPNATPQADDRDCSAPCVGLSLSAIELLAWGYTPTDCGAPFRASNRTCQFRS